MHKFRSNQQKVHKLCDIYSFNPEQEKILYSAGNKCINLKQVHIYY